MEDTAKTVQGHYGRSGLLERILAALTAAGVDPENPRYQDFFPFDKLHSVGVIATADHADRAGLRPGMHVLDLGCGIGGASRYLAADRQCRVTGIDLTPEYIAIAEDLTRRCGLDADIVFHQANALALPFADASFDHVWCHNVTMNIPDKQGLVAEVARVLKPGGRFSCVEVAQGPAGIPTFPVPWAMDAASSFLVTPEEMRTAFTAAGLRMIAQLDITQSTLAYAQDVTARVARGDAPPQANAVVMGDDFAVRVRNSAIGFTQRTLLDQFILAELPQA